MLKIAYSIVKVLILRLAWFIKAQLEKEGIIIFKRMRKQIILFGGSFNPPGLHHLKIARLLKRLFGSYGDVVIIVCGLRPEKEVTNTVDPVDRAIMTLLTFRGFRIDLRDILNSTFTRNHELQKIYEKEGDVWHVVGADIVKDGFNGKSYMELSWENGCVLRKTFNFIVLGRPGYKLARGDLPKNNLYFKVTDGSSTAIRNNASEGLSVKGMVIRMVEWYIRWRELYAEKKENYQRRDNKATA